LDQVTGHRDKPTDARTCLERLRQGGTATPPLTQIESHFLDVIQNDLGAAKTWITPLKKMLKRDDPLSQAVIQRLFGRYYENRSRHRQAIYWTKRALANFEKLNHQEGIRHCSRLLFSAFAHLGNYPRARAQADAMLAFPSLPPEERLKITINLGVLAYRRHNYPTALKHFNAASSQMEHHPNPLLKAIVVYNLGNLEVVYNRFGVAEKLFGQAQEAFRSLGQKLYEAHTHQAFGQLYVILGQYDEAEANLMAAKSSYLRLANPFGAMLCDLEVIRMDIGLNHHQKVLRAMPELLSEFETYGRSVELGQLCYHGATAAVSAGERELAVHYLNDAEAIFRRTKDRFFTSLCHLVRVPWLLEEGSSTKATHLLQKAGAYFRQAKQFEHEMRCLLLNFKINPSLFGESDYNRLRWLLKKPQAPRAFVEGQILLSDYLLQRRQFKKSLRALYTAVNMIEESRASIPNSRTRRTFFEDKAEIYERLLLRLLHYGDNPNLTFRVLQLSRCRQFAEQLSKKAALPPVIGRREPTVLALQKLDLHLSRLDNRLEHLPQAGVADPHIHQKLLSDIQQTQTKRKALKKQLQQEDRLGLFFPLEIEPEAIANLLDPNQLVVLFVRGSNFIYRIEVGREHLRTYKTRVTPQFEKTLNLLNRILSFPIMSRMDRVPQMADEISKALAPRSYKGIDHYIFIPHKSLQLMPLALLRKEGRYLLETHDISQCPNIATLYFTLKRDRPQWTNPVFFLSQNDGDPQASERYVLESRYPEAHVFDNFSQPNIQQVVTDSDFIHFAGHCQFNPRRPSRSFLQINGQRIYLSQIARWRFDRHPFVNLAACQSAQTALDAGNEPFGFVITAIATGASSVLASLWEIDDDATGQWMTAFYNHLPEGLTTAYRKACLTTMKNTQSPYFWSGFALIGQPEKNVKLRWNSRQTAGNK